MLSAREMEGIKGIQPTSVECTSPIFNSIIYYYPVLNELEKAFYILHPFGIRYLTNLRLNCLTSDEFPIVHTPFEDFSNCFGLHPYAMNRLVIKWPAQAAYIKIDF